MRSPRIFLVRTSSSTRAVALAAARQAFPGGKVAEVGAMDDIGPDTGARMPALVVLTEPDGATTAQAIQALDSDGFPRWAVVILGGDTGEFAETIPPENWSPPLVARVFRAAMQQHQLVCENLRLRGDLRTVARRISHDLYTPVGCIYTSAHVLEAVLFQGDVASVEEMVKNIENSSAEIAQIIDRVSFLLRASADPHFPDRVEMAGVVAGVLRELDTDVKAAGATVAQPATWPAVNGVSQWLHVVWWNLLKNALIHGGAGPQLRMTWRLDGEVFRFSLVGRGAPIPATIRTKFYRPFDQLHLMPAPGLGLSIVQRLVALQGGRCGFESSDDGTSTFHFTLPADGFRRLPNGEADSREETPSLSVGGSRDPIPGGSHDGFAGAPVEGAEASEAAQPPRTQAR
jgi:signal transduction histidine kinase